MSVASEQYAYVTTTGRKSGLPREIEIWFVTDGESLYILAELGREAQWVKNILVDPRVSVRVGPHRFAATARVLDPASDAEAYRRAQALSRAKYDWGDGLPVELRPDVARGELDKA